MATLQYEPLEGPGAKRAQFGGSSFVRTSVTSAKELLPSSVLSDPKYPVVQATASFENLNDDASINALTRTYKCKGVPCQNLRDAIQSNKAVEGTWVKLDKNHAITEWEESVPAYTFGGGGAVLNANANHWETQWLVLKEPPVKASDDLYFITASVMDKATVNLHATEIIAGQVVFADGLVMIVEYCSLDHSLKFPGTQDKKFVCRGAICQTQYRCT